jgi:hypothetical protein
MTYWTRCMLSVFMDRGGGVAAQQGLSHRLNVI